MVQRNLTWFNIALGLVSLHYGMGFLLGIAESSYTRGYQGALYGIATSLGILSLVFISKYYWQKKDPLWKIFGKAYGRNVESLVRFLSWIWMIGVVASQVLGAAFILSILGIPPVVSIWVLAAAVNFLSILKLKSMSRLFLGTLILSSLGVIAVVFFFLGANSYTNLAGQFLGGVGHISPQDYVGIGVTTVLITVLGMDFHQFIVAGRSLKHVWTGELVACVVLLVLAFLPAATVIFGRDPGLGDVDSKMVFPLILLNRGNGFARGLGTLIVAFLGTAALGSGIGVCRVVNSTAEEMFGQQGKQDAQHKILVSLVGIIIIGLLAMFGKSIIGLIVSFYT
ncbi:MAG: hypothetical protein HYW33_00345, partial [Candidatus Blackburnbacteria bacterium]|nr:hypothetical protein [Candidatus Blackburnbacteria bacterium]